MNPAATHRMMMMKTKMTTNVVTKHCHNELAFVRAGTQQRQQQQQHRKKTIFCQCSRLDFTSLNVTTFLESESVNVMEKSMQTLSQMRLGHSMKDSAMVDETRRHGQFLSFHN
jgi:hypothetical protein